MLTRRRGERGMIALEAVVVTPVLILMVLLVLWAGRMGRIEARADSVAAEAATAAAAACQRESNCAGDLREMEGLAQAVIAYKDWPQLSCLGGVEPPERPLPPWSVTVLAGTGRALEHPATGRLALERGLVTVRTHLPAGGAAGVTEITVEWSCAAAVGSWPVPGTVPSRTVTGAATTRVRTLP